MKKKASNIVSDIDSLITSDSQSRVKTWFDLLPQDAKEELTLVREKYLSGGYSGTSRQSIARAIISASVERGWAVSKTQGVLTWLTRKSG